jgi:hypothetical protein
MFRKAVILSLILLGSPVLARAASVNDTVRVALSVEDIAMIDIPDEGLQAELKVTDRCPDGAPVCVSGAAVSFLVYGNASVDISVLPAEMAEIGGKKVGVFKPLSDEPDLAPLYYDMQVVIVPEDAKGSKKDEVPIAPLSIKELAASEQIWSSSLDLASGLHRAKVYVRPVIDWNDPKNIVSPGAYVASISLSIASR